MTCVGDVMAVTALRDLGLVFFAAGEGIPKPETRLFLSVSIFGETKGSNSIRYEEDVVVSRNNQCVHPSEILLSYRVCLVT